MENKSLDFSIAFVIADLLQEQPFVVIPALGAFIANESPSEFNSDTHEFSIPSIKISFNRRLITNDGILANRISENLRITFEEANNLIAREVSNFNFQTNVRWEFPELGYLLKNWDNNIAFYSNNSKLTTANYFGLAPLFATPIQLEQPKIITLDNLTIDKGKTKQISYFVAAAIVVGFLIMSSINLDLLSNKNLSALGWNNHSTQKYVYTPINIEEESDFELKPNSHFSLYDFKLVDSSSEGILITLNVTDSLVRLESSASTTSNFSIIVGAFENNSLATRLFNNLIKQGFTPKLIASENGKLTIVSCGDFNTETEAFKSLSIVNLIYPGSWIKAN